MQHIVYSEWLPIVVGCETAARYDLLPRKTGFYTGSFMDFIMLSATTNLTVHFPLFFAVVTDMFTDANEHMNLICSLVHTSDSSCAVRLFGEIFCYYNDSAKKSAKFTP